MTSHQEEGVSPVPENEDQTRIGYKLEDIFADPELAWAIGLTLVQISLPNLVRQGKITKRQETDLNTIYHRAIESTLTPEQIDHAAEEDAGREERNLRRIKQGKRPKFTIHD